MHVKIKEPVEYTEVYKWTKTLLEIRDVDEFSYNLSAFLSRCAQNQTTAKFGEYFRKNYACRSKLWTYSYRVGLELNTNVFLEALHKILKYFYLDGQQNRRVEKCIAILMRFIKNIHNKRDEGEVYSSYGENWTEPLKPRFNQRRYNFSNFCK